MRIFDIFGKIAEKISLKNVGINIGKNNTVGDRKNSLIVERGEIDQKIKLKEIEIQQFRRKCLRREKDKTKELSKRGLLGCSGEANYEMNELRRDLDLEYKKLNSELEHLKENRLKI